MTTGGLASTDVIPDGSASGDRPIRILIVAAVAREADAAEAGLDEAHHRRTHPAKTPICATVLATGVGRVNTAAALAEALARTPDDERVDAIVSIGVAGILPGPGGDRADGAIGTVIVGGASVYHEEGLLGPDGFRTMTDLGFPLGDFKGNRIPADPRLLDAASSALPQSRVGAIATVATCSGTDDAARSVRDRTKAIAEAMEGAAALHVARRAGIPAIELRGISNTTGDRPRQIWDLEAGLAAVTEAVTRGVPAIADRLRND